MSRTIAPTLGKWVRERTCGQTRCGGTAECHVVKSEFWALQAVARSVADLPHADECPAFGFDADEGLCNCWRRALARLRKVSGGTR